MRMLANENFPIDAVELLRSQGHDVGWIRQDAPGSSDRQVLERAVREERVPVTFDKDFGELAFRFGLPAPCGIVLFRLEVGSSTTLAKMVELALRSRDDWTGCFSVVEPHRIHIRRLPIENGPT